MANVNYQDPGMFKIGNGREDLPYTFSATQPTSGLISYELQGEQNGSAYTVRIKFSSVVVTITDALAYGSLEIGSLYAAATANHSVENAVASLAFTKSADASINDAATTCKWAVGTAAASNITLSSTMVDILPKTAISAWTANAATGSAYMTTKKFINSATPKLYLNFGFETNTDIDADGTITVSGELVLHCNSLRADSTT